MKEERLSRKGNSLQMIPMALNGPCKKAETMGMQAE